jgi:hypothetical protein
MCVPLGTSTFAALLGAVVEDAGEMGEDAAALAVLGAADGDAWACGSTGG